MMFLLITCSSIHRTLQQLLLPGHAEMLWGYKVEALHHCVQSKYKAVKFSCKQRAALLTALYQCMTQAAMRGHCPIALKTLG